MAAKEPANDPGQRIQGEGDDDDGFREVLQTVREVTLDMKCSHSLCSRFSLVIPVLKLEIHSSDWLWYSQNTAL